MYYNLKIIHQDEKTITLAAPCAITGREYSVTVPIRGIQPMEKQGLYPGRSIEC